MVIGEVMEKHVIKFKSERGVKLKQPIVWCGYIINSKQWLFEDAQHVALSVGGSVEPCANCIKSIISELKKEL